MKKIVSVLLCVAMVLSLCTAAFATETGGTGTTHYVTVTFDADGGTAAAEPANPYPVTGGYVDIEVPNATKDGYTLKGWVYGENATPVPAGRTMSIEVAETVYYVTVKAVWEKNCAHPITQCTFDDNGDGTHTKFCTACRTVVDSAEAHDYINNGKCLCGAEEPVVEATYRVYYDWGIMSKSTKNPNGQLNATDAPVDGDAYKFADQVTVKEPYNNTTVWATKVVGYVFAGWMVNGDELKVVQPGDKFDVPAGDVTFVAKWDVVTPDAPKTYHVSYNWGELQINDGNEKGQLDAAKAPAAKDYTARTIITVAEPFDNKNVVATDVVGYVFAGWMVNGDEKDIIQPGETMTVDGDIELTAVWTKVDCQHPFVTYKADKGTRTHSATCDECGAVVVDHEKHTYDKKGICTKCGAKKPASSKGGSTTTNTTTTKSPKTGDMGVVLYAATALLSLSGTAVVIKKRKNDK